MNELYESSKSAEIPTLKPIADDTPNISLGFDHAGSHAFNLTRLLNLTADCDNQPNWRPRADLAAAYVDGKQFTPEQEMALIAEGMTDVRPTNLIGRVIRGLCGQEAKARTDIKVESDDDETADVCDVLNQDMKEAQRETYADLAISEAYFGQVGPGIGWVEVAENCDPLEYPDRVAAVHRSEMWWDWKDTDSVISRNGRWQCRKRWADLDELEARMPKHRELLRNVSNGWLGFNWDQFTDEDMRTTAVQWGNDDRTWTAYRRRTDWFDSARKRVKLYEVWYKCPAYGIILHLSPTRRQLYDAKSELHQQVVASGRVKVTKELTTQVRMALFAGPHRLQDVGTARRNFPNVPFFAYRDDEDRSPYGLVEGMIGPQNGYNRRRLRVEWLLRARQIVMDSDALDSAVNSLADIADRINRPDLTVVLNPNRMNKTGAFEVGNNLEMQKEQFGVMQDDKQLVQDVPGVYGSQLGQQASGVTSGIANSLLIEQGAVAMGDLNDNYRHSRRMVFELLLENQVRRRNDRDMQAIVGRGSSRRVVVLNAFDPQTGQIINNVADAPLRVGLGEVPSTPAFRMQQQQQIATIIGAMQANPQAVAVLSPSFIESTDLPNRMEVADDLRRISGIPLAGDKKAQEAAAQKQAQEAEQQKAIQQAGIKLGMEKEAATVNKIKSETELNQAKTFEIGHGAGLAQAEAARPEPGEAPDPDAAKQAAIDDAMKEALSASTGSPVVQGGQSVPQEPVPGSQAAAVA